MLFDLETLLNDLLTNSKANKDCSTPPLVTVPPPEFRLASSDILLEDVWLIRTLVGPSAFLDFNILR